MYAVVDIKGFQYKIEKGEKLRVPKYDLEVGSKIQIPEVLLVSDGEDITIGTPFVDGAAVEATVTGQGKDKKIIVFKKKRRKDYSVKRGHREDFTEIIVDSIQKNLSSGSGE
jgi:large subunit ribosomal protein L21